MFNTNILLLAVVASLIFLNNQPNYNKKTYKYLVKDLIDHHGITQTEWKNNLRINKYLNGIDIGSDNGFIHLSDDKPIILYLDSNEIKLNTCNVNEAIKKMNKMLDSKLYNDSNKKVITNILNNLLKYQDYYYLKKYIKYKNLYNNLKAN